jgi:RNA polymerase sigma factor (sigma-70 family)
VKILERPIKLTADAKLREVFGRWGVDPDDVDDVTILACIQLFKELPQHRPDTEILPWVATIVRSQAVIFARWKQHLRAESAKRLVRDDRAAGMVRAPRQDPHLRACIDRVVARLRRDQRDVYELVFVEDRSVAEAARMLGRSPTWVRERIRKLRAEFSGIR